MAKAIIMPKQGLQMTEGFISAWLAQEGDLVEEGKPLFEMETDKLSITIDASASGTLLKILRPAGDIVPITETIAIVGKPGEEYSDLLKPGAAPADAVSEQAQEAGTAPGRPGERIFASPRAKLRAKEGQHSLADIAGSGPEGLIVERDVLALDSRAAATPLARQLARMENLELSGIAGTGARGKIVAEDVRAAAKGEAVEDEPRVTRVPMSGIRRTIARHMLQSHTDLAQANHRMSADMSEVIRMREQLLQNGVKISLNAFVLRSAAKALAAFPHINAAQEGNDILLYEDINLGVAVATERGLMVPVIRNADRKNLLELAQESAHLANGAKEGTLLPDALQGGTFTVTNLGMYEVESFTAIINAPEAAILAVGMVQKQPVAVGESIALRPIMQLSLTYDHRIIDGAPAALFLKRIRDLLQAPALLF